MFTHNNMSVRSYLCRFGSAINYRLLSLERIHYGNAVGIPTYILEQVNPCRPDLTWNSLRLNHREDFSMQTRVACYK